MSSEVSRDVHIAWATALMSALAASGVTEVVVSPGSRSTPLVVGALATAGLAVRVVVDERAAGFFALGQARVTGRPTVLVCTSGTAVAHYLPAVIEASHARLPMVILSADRPFELHHASASQTIDQLDVLGRAVRHRAVLGVPEARPDALAALGRIGAQAVLASLHPDPGPVHLDVPFRKPLEPSVGSAPVGVRGALGERGAPRLFVPPLGVPDAAVDRLVAAVLGARRGLFVAGPRPWRESDRMADIARRFTERAGMPLLVEATSQLRFGRGDGGSASVVSGRFDAILPRVHDAVGAEPDLLIELGTPPTSAAYARLAASGAGRPRWVLHTHSLADPHATATDLVWGDPAEILERVTERLPEADSSRRSWRAAWSRAEAAVAREIERALPPERWVEPAIGRALIASLPEGTALLVGNSSPVRDIDAYGRVGGARLVVLHQRGAAGIDGLVAGTAGAATVFPGPVVAWIGDVSALHDLGGFACLGAAQRASGRPLVVVVVNNHGGRLFERLPVAGAVDSATFETFFLTPPAIDLASVAAAFGLSYERATSLSTFERALRAGLARGDLPTLVEAVVDPVESRSHRELLRASIDAALLDLGAPP